MIIFSKLCNIFIHLTMKSIHRILLVEDDIDDQYLFCDAANLIRPKIKYRIANNGIEAIKMLNEQLPFDLIFMDVNMPKMDGFECLKYLKNSNGFKHIPVIMLTTSNHPNDIDKCKQLGAASYFIKPATFRELFQKIDGIISQGICQ